MIGLLTAAPTHAPGVISFTIEQLWQMVLSIAGGTKAKLVEWQKAHGLAADGICGMATWSSF